MLRQLALAFALVPATLLGQTVTHYGSPCPPTGSPLVTSGQPSLGSTFTISGFPSAGCGQSIPMVCSFGYLLVGLSSANYQLSVPGLGHGNGCTVLVNHVVVVGPISSPSNYSLQIPNNSGFVGLQLNFQRATMVTFTWPHMVLMGVEFTDGVECVIG